MLDYICVYILLILCILTIYVYVYKISILYTLGLQDDKTSQS